MISAPGAGNLVAGRYRLLTQIGRGAMGIVWHGRDELLDRDVAVKQIVLGPMASDQEARESYQRTIREARTAARLTHPGVVTVYDVAEQDGMPWIVMELIRARPLEQVIAEDGPLTPPLAAQIGLGLLDALACAHAAGVLHRDVKPSNVLITPEGKAILTDFGIAAIQGDPAMTREGLVAGTPGFSPPERVRGADATPASDLWSLGATLYAAVEGRGPFDRAGGSAAIVASIATEPAPRAPSAGPLAPVIEALLRSDPAQRPDLAAARRMLVAAWSGARRASRISGAGGEIAVAGSVPAGDGPAAPSARAPAIASGLKAPASGLKATVSGLGATTATQVVTVAGPASPASLTAAATSQAGATPAGTGRAADVTGSQVAAPGQHAATDIVPDLMATPVFAELRMPGLGGPGRTAVLAGQDPAPGVTGVTGGSPVSGTSADGSDGAGTTTSVAGRPGSWLTTAHSIGDLIRSRRGLVLTAPLTATAIVAGIVFLAFPGFGDTLFKGLTLRPGAAGAVTRSVTSGRQGNAAPGSARRAGTGYGKQGAGGPASGRSGSPGTPSHGSSPGPGPSGHPSPSGQPSPSSPGSPSGSPAPTPSPSPTSSSPVATGSRLPLGYVWQSVTASSAGTTAGWRLGVPVTWVLTPGVQSYLRPPAGAARLGVDLAPFARQAPVREARHLQAAAIAHGTYRRYQLVSILPRRFHDWPAATWTFRWTPAGRPVIDVTEVLFTATTSAGPQPYDISMAAPAAHATFASHVLAVALRTFSSLP